MITTIIDSVTFSYIFGKEDSPLGINITGEFTMLSARGAGVSVSLVPVVRLQYKSEVFHNFLFLVIDKVTK